VVSATPRPIYPREGPGTHCIGGWVWTGAENIAPPPGFNLRTFQPIASESLYRLRYLVPCTVHYTKQIKYFFLCFADHLSSIFILVINQLDAQNLFYVKFISCLDMFQAHVPTVRRSELYHTASGIITLKQVSCLKLLKYIL